MGQTINGQNSRQLFKLWSTGGQTVVNQPARRASPLQQPGYTAALRRKNTAKP
jgi:hypothetical protein